MKRRCPKCGELPFYLNEVWNNNGLQFDVDKNGNISKEGILTTGDPVKVVAHCICGHHWRLRNILQITDLLEE